MKKRLSAAQISWLFVLFHLMAVLYAVFFLHPYYGSNDEFSLAAIASGAYGDYTTYFIYLHSGFAWLLKFFYTLAPSLNWYTLVMYGLIFLSLTAVGCAFIRRSPRTGGILSVMLVLACLHPLYVEMQYTKTAAAVTAAGYVLLFAGARRKRVQAAGILFLLLGSWIRFQAFGMVSLVAFGLWLAPAVRAFRTRELAGFFKKDCLPCLLAFVLVVGSIAAENILVYRPGTPEAHYREYDRARQKLLDYGVPEWDEYQEEYEALGLTRTDCINLQNWLIADYDRYTAQTFQDIVAFRKARPFQWEYLLDYLVILAKKPLFLLGALLTLLWIFCGKRKNWISVLYPYAAVLGIYLYFIKIYRVLPIVVTACLISFVIFVWTAAQEEIAGFLEERLTGRNFLLGGFLGAALTGGLCVRTLLLPALRPPMQASEASLAFRELYDTISRDKELYYTFDPFTSNGMELGYSIFEKLPDNYLTNIFSLGGWETESPQVVENLENYEQRSLLTSLYTSDRAVLISNTLLEHIMLHLQDTYDGIFITYSKVGRVGNFDLFTLNYRMSGLKDGTDAASLDRAYTAEDGRYDVFEGTVHMDPEELNGKSVFLCMESRESGKRRMYQGVWGQDEGDGLPALLYDAGESRDGKVRFTIPKMSYPLDDRYEVHIVLRENDRGTKLVTENNLYAREE